MRCLADFVLDSDLCRPKGAAPLKLHAPNGSFTLELSNAEHDPTSPEAVLSAQLIFEADTLDANTRELAGDKLADALNSLTYATNRKFTLNRLKRLIDWTPGIVERAAIIYVETPEWDLAEPALNQDFLDGKVYRHFGTDAGMLSLRIAESVLRETRAPRPFA